jgi:predicted XRE-type DNA-binding protein
MPKPKTNSPPTAKPAPRVELGSGNVFADLGLKNSDLALAKAELVQRIRSLIEEQGLTQVKAAKLLGVPQPKVSALVRGNVSGFSLDRLFRLLLALGQTVKIKVTTSQSSSRAPRGILVST